MIKCKNYSMMLSEIERVRGEQLNRTPEAQRFVWLGVQFSGRRIQFFPGTATQGASLRQVLPQQTVGVLVDAALRVIVRYRRSRPSPQRPHSSMC